MEPVYVIGLAAMLVEALVQVIKGFVPNGISTPHWLWPLVSTVLGVALCVLARVDAVGALGLPLASPFVGEVITGVLISRGSNFEHDLWDHLTPGKKASTQNG